MTTDILIPNYNGGIALQLCIESIAAYTHEPHRVVVYDDASTNPGELEYLHEAFERGLIYDIEGSDIHGGHGEALNQLINGFMGEKYAVILDNDIQILRRGWLSGLLGLASNPKTLIVCNSRDTVGYCSRGYRPGMFQLWFGLINMMAYGDMGGVNWAQDEARREDEPWRSMFADLYPPEGNAIYQHLVRTQWEYGKDFDRDKVIFDPGAVLWAKMRHDNPRGYISQPLTPNVMASFRHWGHAQAWLESDTEKGKDLRQRIGAELSRLRCD